MTAALGSHFRAILEQCSADVRDPPRRTFLEPLASLRVLRAALLSTRDVARLLRLPPFVRLMLGVWPGTRRSQKHDAIDTLPAQTARRRPRSGRAGHRRSSLLAVSILARLSPLSRCCSSLSCRSRSCPSCCSRCSCFACIACTLSSLSRFPFHDSQVSLFLTTVPKPVPRGS